MVESFCDGEPFSIGKVHGARFELPTKDNYKQQKQGPDPTSLFRVYQQYVQLYIGIT